MKRLLFVLAALSLVWFFASCEEAEDAAEDIVDDGLPEVVDENDLNVDTPEGWDFLFALQLSANEAEALDEDWSVSLELLEQVVGDIEAGDNQIICAKEVDLEDFGYRLQFSTKAIIDGDLFKVDPDTELLGGAAGGHGSGIYIFYHSEYSVGFITGTVEDCNGNAKEGILVTATDSPFFTYTISGGKWAMPVWNVNTTNPGDAGNSVEINFNDGDCSGTLAIGTALGDNGKVEMEPYAHETMGDNSDVIVSDPMAMSVITPEREPDPNNLDFETGDFSQWNDVVTDSGGPYPCAQVLSDAYGTFFPNGSETYYALLSTGGSNRATVTLMRTVLVPENATTMEVSYDFISQEYAEWVGSGFNDIFSLKIKGAPDYVIYRTINNTAQENLWEGLSDATAQGVGGIDGSSDASHNPSGKIYDGHIKANARGPRITNYFGQVSDYDISTYQGQEITLIITISDVGDKIYDSAVLIDYIKFN